MERPYPGIQVHTNVFGIVVARLHYEADPDKGLGEKVFVPDINKWLSPWAKKQYDGMTDKNLFLQEFEVDFSATQGSLVYQMDPEATLEKSFPIPEDWTRYYILDPHLGKPHCHLWVAVDPWGDGWCFREFWPSKIYGKPGRVPEDDNRATIKQHVEVVKWLESDENPENEINGVRFNEKIYERVIDYAARGFGQDQDKPDAPNYQKRFEMHGDELGIDMRFKDCVKDLDAGYEAVNEWLKPRQVEGADGTWKKKAKLHIFEDRCPELIYELQNVRRQQLTPAQQMKMDPTGKPIAVRNHMVDCLRYFCMNNPQYVAPVKHRSTMRRLHDGIGY